MQYNIHINQAVLAEENDLDVADCAILDYLIWLCNSKDPRVEKQRYKGYTWVNYKYLIKEMPLLRITSTSNISVRVNKLVKTKFIKTIKKKDNRLFVLLEPKIDTLFRKQNRGVAEIEQGAVAQTGHYSNTISNSFTNQSNPIYTGEISKKISQDDKKIKDTEKKKSKNEPNKSASAQSRIKPPSPYVSATLSPSFNWKTPEGVHADYVKHCIEMGPRFIWDYTKQHENDITCPEKYRNELFQTQLSVSGEQFAEIIISLMEQFGRINPGANTLCYKDEQWQALEEMVENREIGVGGILDFIRMRDFQDRRGDMELTKKEELISNFMRVSGLPPCKTPVSFRNECKKFLMFIEAYADAVELIEELKKKKEIASLKN